MSIKRTPADAAFSNCIRERANWSCEKCGNYFPEGRRGGLDCSHHHGRGSWSIRFDPLNAEALCYGCHSHYGGTQERRQSVLTEWEQDVLFERKADTGLGKMYRKTKGVGEIAKHYRDELKRMRELREAGETGRIEFESYL
jgi:hypothetical protein